MSIRFPFRRRDSVTAAQDVEAFFEPLEKRELLTVEVNEEITNISTGAMGFNYAVSLLGRYTDTAVTQVVRLVTNYGNIDIAMRSDWAPNTVTNFLQYVNEHLYDNTIFHYSNQPAPGETWGTLGAGGFRPPTTNYSNVLNDTNHPTLIPEELLHDPVALEHPTGNVAFTVAMIHPANSTSSRSQFFIHTFDNTDEFDAAPNENFPGYGTFGQVLPFTRGTVMTINNFPYYQAGGAFGTTALNNLPLDNTIPVTFPITPSQYMIISSATVLENLDDVETTGWTVNVTSGANIATASIVNGNVVITPTAAHNRGTVTINVHATSNDGTASADDSFTFTIGNYAPVIGGMQGQSNVAVGQSMLVSAFGVRDPDANTGGGLANVEYWFDADNDGVLNEEEDVLVGSDSSAAGGWNARIDTSEMSAGENRVFARVTDTDGESAVTSRVFTLREAVPTSGIDPEETSVPVGQDVNLGFNNELPDISGIRRVSLFIDTDNDGELNPLTDRLIGFATYSSETSSWGYTVNADDLAEGANRIFARVSDNYGNMGGITSSVITVGV